MSDRVANSYYSSDGKAGQPIHYYQSAWMGHWAGTAYNASTQKHNHSFSPRGNNTDEHNIKTHQFLSGTEIARSSKGLQEVEHGKAENIKGLAMSSRNLADESLKSEKEIISMKALRPQASRGKLPAALNILPVSVPATETSTGECQFQPEGLLQIPVEQVKCHMFFGESNFSCSRQRSTVLASHTVPNKLDINQFKFDSGSTAVPLFIHRQEENKQVTSILSSKHVTKTNLIIMGEEHCDYQGHSAVLFREGKTNKLPESEKGATSYLRQDNMAALKIGPSAGTCINLCKEKQILRETKGTTQLNQNTFSKLHRNFPLFNHGKQGVKLQLLGGSTESGEKEDAGVCKTSEIVQKNESSTETDIMDMESFREKEHISGVSPAPSNKDMLMDPNLAPPITSTALAGSKKRTIELPDINVELPVAPASPETEKPEPRTSRTQSLDMEILLSNSDKPDNSKSPDCSDTRIESELSSRWVKRLKLTSPNSNLEEQISHEGGKRFFSKTMKGTTSSSGPATAHRPGKELMELDQTTKLIKTGESSSIDTQDISLSHSWIQRWRHNQDKKKPKTLVNCDPQSSKFGTGEVEKKEHPSIAAMALMGKVMNGFFQPCQFQKKKSFIVWNTKNL